MNTKNRERIVNKEKYKKKRRKKKANKKLKEARAISRETRNYVRKQIKPYYNALRKYANKTVLIVLKETENMEKILFQKDDIGREISFYSLPIISAITINVYLESYCTSCESTSNSLINNNDDAIKALLMHLFSIHTETIINSQNMLIAKNCRIICQKARYVALNVRPYDMNTWYSGDTTSLYGYRVYKGKKLKTFFNISGDISKSYIYHDTISMILLYRSIVGKINMNDFLRDHSSLAQRQFLSTSSIYLILFGDDDRIAKRFEKEEEENQALNREED